MYAYFWLACTSFCVVFFAVVAARCCCDILFVVPTCVVVCVGRFVDVVVFTAVIVYIYGVVGYADMFSFACGFFVLDVMRIDVDYAVFVITDVDQFMLPCLLLSLLISTFMLPALSSTVLGVLLRIFLLSLLSLLLMSLI